MTNQLIPVFNGSINNDSTLLCNARDLHGFLDVGKVFAAWITSRVKDYGFVENQDYVLVFQNGKNKSGRGGDRRSKDYHLTLDTAKELAMVERNEKGRQVRRYFIECEKRLLQVARTNTNCNAHPACKTPLRSLVNRLRDKYGIPYQPIYRMIHIKFGVNNIDELSPGQAVSAIEYLATKVIEGEFLGKDTLSEPILHNDYSMSFFNKYRWIIGKDAVSSPDQYPAALLTQGGDYPSPCGMLLNELRSAGCNVDAAIFQIQALQHHLEISQRKFNSY